LGVATIVAAGWRGLVGVEFGGFSPSAGQAWPNRFFQFSARRGLKLSGWDGVEEVDFGEGAELIADIVLS
jgi:hypothetical protein